jgi:two-component system, NtrC family, sensor histidine kinase KinB
MDNEAKKPAAESSKGTRASLELLYHVSREFAAALDLGTVLQQVLFLSVKTVGATSGSIIVLDDQGKAVESAIITGTKLHKRTTQRLRFTLEEGLAGWVVRNRQAVLIEDSSKDERWKSRPAVSLENSYETKAVVSAPLLVRERLIGVMTLANSSPGYFSEDHLSLVQAIADQAGIAVLNARLYAESQRQARVMTALAESAAVINASLNLEDVLIHILEQIHHALQVDAVSLALIDHQEDALVFRAAIGWPHHINDQVRLKIGQGIAGQVARNGQEMVYSKTAESPPIVQEIRSRTGLDPKTVAAAPIRSRGEVIGVLEAINPGEDGFDGDVLLVLNGIGSLAGTAIHNAQLFESLEAAHKRYRDLFEDSIEPIIITDWEGSILEANRQAIQATRFSIEELRNMQIDELHELGSQKNERLEQLTRGVTISYESNLNTSSVKTIPVQVFARQVTIENKPYLQWILRDITERKNLDALREDLMSMAYHDLRSPLANIVSSLNAIDTILPADLDPLIRSLIAIALRSTERVERLTNSLLDISRLEAGQPIGVRQPVDPAAIVCEAMEVIRSAAESKSQHLEAFITDSLPPVLGDPDMLRRVIINLLENAVKFTPNGGRVEIGAEEENNWVQIWVCDTGSGIPQEEHETIFQKFTRLIPQRSPKGFGLGLNFCRLAIEAHGGKIWVESEPEQGSRFFFNLPAAVE